MSAGIAHLVFALGGGFGACARHALGRLLAHRPAAATLAVNVLGSALLGAIAGALGGALDGIGPGAPAPTTAAAWAALALVGLCGGFTTFSSFAWQTLGIARADGAARAIGNVALNLAGSIAAFALGAAVGSALAVPPVPDGAPDATPDAGFVELDCLAMTSDALDRETWFGDGAGAATCGLVTVPAERDAGERLVPGASGERALRLAVYRVPSTSPDPAPDPVVYLEGGPGGAGVALLASLYDPDAPDGASFLRERGDVIVVDQRGTGWSRPALYCPEVYAAQETGDDEVDAHRACAARLRAEGVVFSDYDSRESAADLEAVRAALGIERWNLYGLSYGTRLALTAMRDAPGRIRSVVLDSAFPIEVNGFADEAWTTWQALERIAAAGDARPGAEAGDTLATIEAGFARLDVGPLDGLDPARYLSLLRDSVGDPDAYPLVEAVAALGAPAGPGADPATALELADALEAARDPWLGEPWSMDEVPRELYPIEAESADAMYYAVACAEELGHPEAVAMPDLSGGFSPTLRRIVAGYADHSIDARICAVYDVPAADPVEVLPVRSDVPTLVLAGAADVVTPPAWGRLVADELGDARYVELPGLGHGVLGMDDCSRRITLAFLDEPAGRLDASCASRRRTRPDASDLEHEARPAPDERRRRPQREPVRVGRRLRERQPEPAARRPARARAAVEALEHPLALARRDARTVVLDAQRAAADQHAHGAAGRAELDRVGQEVVEQHRHRGRVRAHAQARPGVVDLDADPMRHELRGQRPEPLAHQLPEIDHLELHRRRALQPREAQQLLDQLAAAPDRGPEVVEQRRQRGVGIVAPQQLLEHLHRRDRRAQLVRGVVGEALLAGDACLDAAEQLVDRIDDGQELARPALARQPLQVVHRASIELLADAPERRERAVHGPQRDEQHERGQREDRRERAQHQRPDRVAALPVRLEELRRDDRPAVRQRARLAIAAPAPLPDRAARHDVLGEARRARGQRAHERRREHRALPDGQPVVHRHAVTGLDVGDDLDELVDDLLVGLVGLAPGTRPLEPLLAELVVQEREQRLGAPAHLVVEQRVDRAPRGQRRDQGRRDDHERRRHQQVQHEPPGERALSHRPAPSRRCSRARAPCGSATGRACA